MSIFVIRHGETAGNADRVVQHPETALSPRGLEQAGRLAERLSALGVERILSSDYARAAGTAAAVQERTGAPLTHAPELRERHYGELRGRPYTEVGDYIMMEGYEPPGGESWDTFHARVDQAWERIQETREATSGNLAVFTHGLVCYSLALRHLRLADGSEAPTRFGNTALTIVDPAPPWQVRLLACCAHLDESVADDSASPSGL